MRFVLTSDPAEFAARTRRLLSERIECNVLATVLMNVLDGTREDSSSAVFAYGLDDARRGPVRGAANATVPLARQPAQRRRRGARTNVAAG